MRAVLLLTAAMLVVTEAAFAAKGATVGVIASDMPQLAIQTSRDDVPSDQAIDAMVREAMMLGGIRDVLKSDAQHVLLKPCIVVAKRDPERNTDPRAIRAVALVVHEIAPQARITIGEGPGAWMTEARPEVKHWELVIADGFETEGYRAALDDPRLQDAEIDFVDLNFAETRLVKVPGGGMAQDEYWMPAPVLDADVTITVPRLKTHMAELGGITVAMKNQVGVAPGMKYGWPKRTGYPSGSGNPGIPHSTEILGETITDLNLCAGIDFAVAESFRREMDRPGGRNSEWVNAVVAGADLVAVDAVSAYLMGFNPEEVETIVNGERRGLGVGRLEAIAVRGETELDRIRRGFSFRGAMGMANRMWTVSGPYPRNEEGMGAVDPAGEMRPGAQGFGDPVWFHDDKCDLGQLLDKPFDSVAFAYCEFDAPRSEAAQLQVASDESMTVWVNGEEVYRFDGWRRVERPNEMVPIRVKAGRNAVLCRLEQSTRKFLFSVNVVIAAPDPLTGRHARIAGLRFRVPSAESFREVHVQDMQDGGWTVPGWWREASVDQTRSDSLSLEGVVPEVLQAKGLGITRSRYLGDTMRLRAMVRGEEIEIHAADAAQLWVDLGLLRGAGQPATVRVVEFDLRSAGRRRGLIETVRDSAVVWSGTVPETAVLVLNRPSLADSWSARWAAAAPLSADSADVVVGELTGEVQDEVFAVGLAQSSGGALLAEAYRELVGADLGIAMGWEVRSSLPAGPVMRGSLLDFVRSEDVRLVSWTMSGVEVKVLLEGLLEQAARESFVSPQFSGFTATVDLSRSKGERVLQSSLEPERTYRVATLDRDAGWFYALFSGKETGGRRSWWFGPPESGGEVWPDQVDHQRSPVQAVEAFLGKHRPYTPVEESSLAISQVEAR